MNKCKDCKYYVESYVMTEDVEERTLTAKFLGYGRCQVNPPRAEMDKQFGYWPMVYDTSWCGSWQEKE